MSMKFSALARKSLRSINAVTRGSDPNPYDIQIAFEACNDMLDAWAAQRLTMFQTKRRVFTATAGKGSPTNPYTIGPGGNLDMPRPVWIPNAECQVTSGPTLYEYPLNILKDDAWARTSIKALSSALPNDLYYDYGDQQSGVGAGLGNLYLYPVPNGQQIISIVLYTPEPLTQFADIDTTLYTFPPGYAEALRYQLAIRLAIELGFPVDDDLGTLAATTFGVIKRANATRVPLLRGDRGMAGLAGGGYYDWRTGTMAKKG